jgi:tetratricopeptide (TPR) repeat protein
LTDDPLATMRLTASEVLLERIGMRLQRVILSGLQFTTSAALLCGALSAAFAAEKPATSVATRVATFETGAGDRFFAASIQPSADPALLKQLRSRPAAIAIIVDTSASQVGDYRKDQLASLEGILSGLRAGDTVQIFASDVATTAMSQPIDATDKEAVKATVAKLRRRLPLGNTNLSAALESARAALVARPEDETRSIIYIGDGASIDTAGNEARMTTLVDAFRADRVSIHGLAVGPSKNVELMATLANQTGGDLLLVSDEQENMAVQLGKQLGQAATTSPIWVESIQLPTGLSSVQAKRVPPLRVDRDSVLLGTISGSPTGLAVLSGESSAGEVSLEADFALEPSHPDFAFLPGMVASAKGNDGLMLPTAGSAYLREAARVLATRATELAQASSVALQQGNRRGAQAVAEMALEADPNNTDAQAIKKLSAGGYRLVMKPQDDDPFGGLFGDEPAGAAADMPAADAPAAGDDPFGEPAPAAAAAVEPPPAPADVPPAPAPPAAVAPVPPAPAPAIGAPAERPSMLDSGAFDGPLPGDDELLEEPSGLLDAVAAERAEGVGRLRAEVRAQLRAARRLLDSNPVGVAGSLKNLLNRVETQPGVDPQIRQELQGQVRSAIQVASRREAAYIDAQATASQVVAAASQTEQLLQETFRREERLRTLSNQLNALIDEGRYDEADADVSRAIATLAATELAGTSVIGNQAILETQMLNNYVRGQRLKLLRERNYLDALALVEKSNIPFVDEPPIMYPDAEQWQRLSRTPYQCSVG